MATDKYANTDLENGKLGAAAYVHGNKTVIAISTFEIDAGAEADSVYRLFPDLNPCLIPVDIKVMNDSTGTAGGIVLGLYNGNKGTVIDKSCFASDIVISTEHAKTSAVDGLGSLAIADLGKQLFELAGHTIADRKDTYDIAATVKTAPTSSGTITVVGTFVQG